ncbi:MAG: ParB/RepB/Spo0J family partition protein [Candidatus Latescibacterota bacterium]|nr:MAG: ParB/RepB/Spo0J family partition protein [Candidatus Latescibacterota bacterium]
MTKKVLGRGLGALISQDLRESVSETERVKELDVEKIDPNPHQPRAAFDDEHLRELAESIKRHGVLQPVVVRRAGDRYELVLGERRLRAAKLCGKTAVPAIVREMDDAESLKQALMENLQREDLNAVEEARGYELLRTEFSLSAKDIADMIGKDRSTVANCLRILALPDEVKELIVAGRLTAGHARALLGIEGAAAQIEWARRIVSESLTVREIERTAPGKPGKKRGRAGARRDPELRAVEEALEVHLGSRVRVAKRGKGGQIAIEFYSAEDLERILERLGVKLPS